MVDQIKDIGTPSLVFANAWTQFINSEYGYSSMVNSLFKPTLLDDIENSISMLANYEQFLEDKGLIKKELNNNISKSLGA